MFTYRVGAPFWRLAARVVPLKVLVCVSHDDEANVYTAYSPDLTGLVVEGRTLDELWPEIQAGIESLLEEELPPSHREPVADLRIYGAHCAA